MIWRVSTVGRFGAGVLVASLAFLFVAAGGARSASAPTAITGPVTAYRGDLGDGRRNGQSERRDDDLVRRVRQERRPTARRLRP